MFLVSLTLPPISFLDFCLPSHASRYFEFYMPSGAIEIAHTSRYSHVTGKSELCILATRALPIGTIITGLKGSMADLTPEEERRLKHGDPRAAGLGVRKDFSVIHSKQKKMNHLFLGPARFVNVSGPGSPARRACQRAERHRFHPDSTTVITTPNCFATGAISLSE